MQVSVKLRNLRIAPRKVRLVADLLRGKTAEEAQAILNFTIKKPVFPILKLLNSALANAKNMGLDPANLYISRITADEGQKLKRWRARARGSANEILKRTSHINIVLSEIAKSQPSPKLRRAGKKVTEAPLVKEMEVKEEKIVKDKKEQIPKLKPEIVSQRPKAERGVQRIFRRKAF